MNEKEKMAVFIQIPFYTDSYLYRFFSVVVNGTRECPWSYAAMYVCVYVLC